MWILSWLPYWIFYAVALIGVVGYFLTYLLRFVPIPALYIYKTPIQIVSIALIAIGVYMSGAIANEEAWQAKVKELEVKVAQAEAKAAEENIKIVEKVVFRDRVIKEKGDDIIRYIDREVVKKEEVIKFIENCPIPAEIVNTHNEAIKQLKGNKK
jgi:hypothetical protein